MTARANTHPAEVFAEANAAATEAMRLYLKNAGHEPMYCGFAWVRIMPARGGFINWLKGCDSATSYKTGGPAYNGGWRISGTGDWPTSGITTWNRGLSRRTSTTPS